MRRVPTMGWIGLMTFSLSVLLGQGLSDRQIHYRPGDWVSFPMTRFVTSVAIDPQTVYFGTTGGILRYRFFERRWEPPLTVSDGLEGTLIFALAYDPSGGFLWAATEKGICGRHPASDRWMFLPLPMAEDRVVDLGVGTHRVWVRTLSGCYALSRPPTGLVSSSLDEAMSDGVDWGDRPFPRSPDEAPFFYLEEGLLFHPDGQIEDTHLRKYPITALLSDQFTTLWIGTAGLGGGRAETLTQTLVLMPYGLYIPDVRVMAWDRGGMWIGGVASENNNEEGGITWWDMERDSWRYFEAPWIPGLSSHDVEAIAVRPEAVFFGTRLGLSRYDRQKGSWRTFSVRDGLPSEQITALASTDSVLWIGTASGIAAMRFPSHQIQPARDRRLVHRMVYSLAPDGEEVWAGTDEGLFHYQAAKRRWDAIPCDAGLLVRGVTAVSATSQEVWIGTNDGIAVYHKPSGRWRGYPHAHFFEGDVFNDILVDEQAVWVATDQGVLKWLRAEDRWRRFTTRDGLLDNRVRWILLDGDWVWFGTARGLTRFYWNAPYRTD